MSRQDHADKDLVYLAAPALFVCLWSGGFIAAKAGLAHADTLTFLSLRYALVTVLMGIVAVLMKAPWPKTLAEVAHISVAGFFLQALYFGSVWVAMGKGVGAGTAALIVCLQPVATAAVVGPLLGERVSARQWLGLVLGFSGVALVVARRLSEDFGTLEGMVWAFVGLVGITVGTLYQKKFCPDMDTRTGPALQFLVAAIILTPMALALEAGVIHWTTTFIASLVYISVFLSLISVVLLTVMIRRGEAARVTSLFFLVPPTAAALGYLILDEPVGVMALLGMAVAAAGVALVMVPAHNVKSTRE